MAKKPYKEMDIEELKHESLRLQYELNHTNGNYIAYKQNKKSLKNIEILIAKKIFEKTGK